MSKQVTGAMAAARGVMVGPPGTGKTLARAVAGEAQVTFYGLAGVPAPGEAGGQTMAPRRVVAAPPARHAGGTGAAAAAARSATSRDACGGRPR